MSRSTRSRTAGWAVLLTALTLVCRAAPATASDSKPEPLMVVPLSSWIYDVMMDLEQNRFYAGFPGHLSTGVWRHTRYEFALALRQILNDRQFGTRTDGALDYRLHSDTVKLIRELSPELELLGIDPALLRRQVVALSAFRGGDAPDLARVAPAVYPGVGAPDDPEYARGYWLAVAEWQAADVAFYVASSSTGPRISVSTGVRYRVVATGSDELSRLTLIAGHNAEVKRRIERFGPPASARPDWVEALRHPEQPWQAGASPLTLDALRPEAASADGRLRLRLVEGPTGLAPLLRVTSPERTREVPLPDFDFRHDTLEVCRSSGSELLHLAIRRPEAKRVTVRVIELKSGDTLRQVELPALSLRSTRSERIPHVYPSDDESK